MDIIMSRTDASLISSGLELLVRLSMGQFDEINQVSRMSSFGDVNFDKKMALSDDLSDDIRSWRQSALGMSPGGYFGIFSRQVSDEAREMMAISKMLRQGVLESHHDHDSESDPPQWVPVSIESTLLAYDVSCRSNAIVMAGTQPSGVAKDTEALVCIKGGILTEDISSMGDGASVLLSLPAVDRDWFLSIVTLGYRAYWSITGKEGYVSCGLSSIEEWLKHDTSEACGVLGTGPRGEFLSMVKKALDQF